MSNSNNTFDKGVDFGGLRNRNDIRLLVCYLLKSIDVPIPKSLLNNAIQECSLANYFEVNQALSDLQENHNVKCELIDGEEVFCVTETGKTVAEMLQTGLSWSVRDKVVRAAINLLTIHRRERENNIEITKKDNGYNITIDIFAINNIKDDNNKILSLSLHVSDALQAERIKDGFLKNPTKLCEAIMNSLLDETNTV